MTSPLTSDRSNKIKRKWVLDVPISRSIADGLFVCWRNCCRWPIPSIFLLPISSFTFCVASVDPPTAPLKRKHPRWGQLQIALVISVSLVLLLALSFGMGLLFRFLRLKKQRRSKAGNQVESVDTAVDDSKGKNCCGDDSCSVRKYSFEEIKLVTMNFARVIGSGGFSNVYFANLAGSDQEAAVKVHVSSNRLNQVFKQELDILLRLRHGNIVKLLGYSDDQEEGAMVFEYVPNGNLQEKLHEGESVLPWRHRTVIAFQLAQAIEYLHEKCTIQIVHGDIKASNILLDENLNCKLCDFGSAKMGFSSTVLPPTSSLVSHRNKPVMIGSPGYTDPHYLRTGIASKKNDIYSLGVLILELVTGIPAFCPEKGQQLTSVLAPTLRNIAELEVEEKLAELVDPRLTGEFDRHEFRAMFSVAASCLHQSPILRPSATQILQILEQKIPSISMAASLRK